MKGCRLLASALSFQAFTVLGAFVGVLPASAADQVSPASVISEDVPKAAAELQKMISTLGLNVTPCSAPDPVGADPLICTDPIKAICGSQSADARAQREKLIESFEKGFLAKVQNQIQLKLDKNTKENPQSQSQDQTELELERTAIGLETEETLLFELLKVKGWSKESVKRLFERAKAIELSKIRLDDTIHPNRVKVLTSTPWLTSEVFRKLPLEQRQIAQNAIVTVCGNSLLSSNAYTVILSKNPELGENLGANFDAGKAAGFIICPGLILQAALSDSGPDSIAYVVGHELGHILQPLSQVKGTLKIESPEDRRKLAEAEKSYGRAIDEAELACPRLKGCFVRKALFSDGLYLNSCDVDRAIRECGADPQATRKKVATIQAAAKARQVLIGQLTTPPGDTDRDRALLSCLKMNDLNEMNNGREKIAAFEKIKQAEVESSLMARLQVLLQIDAKKREYDEFEKKWGRAPDSVDLHQGELVADYWGGEVTDEVLKDMPDFAARKASVSSNFSAFCEGALTQSRATDTESHPAWGYRIERILSKPGIRSSLGCKSPPPRVWCER